MATHDGINLRGCGENTHMVIDEGKKVEYTFGNATFIVEREFSDESTGKELLERRLGIYAYEVLTEGREYGILKS